MAVKYNGIEKFIFADVYNLFLKYKDVPNQDYYFECLVKDTKMLNFKYKNHPLAKSLIVETVTHLEKVILGKEINGHTREEWEEMLNLAHKIGW